MKNRNHTTLVMLLSTAKLQDGEKPEGGLTKRWQTPAEVVAQTQEAIAHLKHEGRKPKQVVLLYTDTLYLNNDNPAVDIIKSVQEKTFEHRRETQKLFHEAGVPVDDMLWSELLQSQTALQQPRDKLIQLYQTNTPVRTAVQQGNPKRKGRLDPIPAGKKAKGSVPLASDQFMLEEIGAFDALAKGFIQSDKINADNDIVIAYPGPALSGQRALYQNSLRVFNGKSLRNKAQASTTSWLDVSDTNAASEEILYRFTPHPETVKQVRKKQRNVVMRMAGKVAAVVVPVLAVSSLFFGRTPKPEPDQVIVKKNNLEAMVTIISHGGHHIDPAEDTLNVRFGRNMWNKDTSWTAEGYSYGAEMLMRNFDGEMLLPLSYPAEKIMTGKSGPDWQ